MRFPLRAVLLLLLLSSVAHAQPTSLKQEVDGLLSAMVKAFKEEPASVARFYADDARILGGGQRAEGRQQIDQYWRDATMFADWALEAIEVGGEPHAPWVRGRSTLQGRSGRSMVTEFIGLLRRQPDGSLRFVIDMYVSAGPMRRPGGA
jgi:ketosteroid isomerase-like protein